MQCCVRAITLFVVVQWLYVIMVDYLVRPGCQNPDETTGAPTFVPPQICEPPGRAAGLAVPQRPPSRNGRPDLLPQQLLDLNSRPSVGFG